MITGSIVALVTPMLPGSAAIDYPALGRLVEWHVAQGSDALVAVGTTGESPTLAVDEHLQVIEFCVRQAAGRIPVIAGTGANSTAEAIELTGGAREAGADACLLVTPYYNKPTQEGLYLHHRAIAEAVAIPQILYNVPSRTACDMQPETVLRLAGVPNIVGIKEATGNLDRARRLIAAAPPDFAVYSGDDASAMELMLLGGRGNVSVTANVAPALMARMCAAALRGDRPEAERLNRRLQGLNRALFLESNPIPVKWALARLGLISEAIRLPMTPLSADLHQPVYEAMIAAGAVENPPAAMLSDGHRADRR
ncbi:MAG: 4-hydroxy-tetrahydrodipicolinate synthase [Pseudomonadota bacterium]|jgi:4-hydroxy-tetrahydrodipicolinate synthase